LGILVVLTIVGFYVAFCIHRANLTKVKKRYQLTITYLGERKRHGTDSSDYEVEEGRGRSYGKSMGTRHRKEQHRRQRAQLNHKKVTITPDDVVDDFESTGQSGRFTYTQEEEDDDNNSNEGSGMDK
jgi:hypothetical protein